MAKPLTTRTDHQYVKPTENQPPVTIIENKPAATVAQAVANSKAAVEKAR